MKWYLMMSEVKISMGKNTFPDPEVVNRTSSLLGQG